MKQQNLLNQGKCATGISVTFGKDEIADMGGKASRAKNTVGLRFGGR